MKKETIEILGVKLNKENFPVLYNWAVNDKEGLEQRLLADLKPNEKPSTLLVMLEVDLEEQGLNQSKNEQKDISRELTKAGKEALKKYLEYIGIK